MRRLCMLALSGTLVLSACGGGGTSGGPPPTPVPTSTPVSISATCPTSGSLPSSFGTATGTTDRHRAVAHRQASERFVAGQVAVTYAGAPPALHGSRIADLSFTGSALRTRIVSIDDADVESAMTRFRALPNVRAVSRVSYRHRLSITANDPYYAGFTGTTAPYFENASTPGQWDMHVINLNGAWSQFASAPVVGAPVAVVDTGVDVTHPELKTPAGGTQKVSRAQCYVTYPSSSAQTTGPYVTDTDGHGTNVAGIADGDTNNDFGFAGVAFGAPLLAYRIFPTEPSGGCDVDNPPAQCDASSSDEASAINDAVAHGAKVINLSLGASPPCSSGDPEYIAVENAIAKGVVVVAAAGNGDSNGIGQPVLDCPAADPGVIAVGASALNDSNPLNVFEYVAAYSNYLTSTGTSNGGAYLVAPGGDPCSGSTGSSCDDSDNLHWIEHIYSSTAVESGSCNADFAKETGNCRVLIAGTSQATPHVAGVVSLMLAKNPRLTPADVARGLCASADDIGDPAKQGCGRVNASAAVAWAATH